MPTLPNPDSINWNAPFRPGENLRILTPIAQPRLPKKDRKHLASMPREYRARLEAEWQAGESPSIRERISDQIKARADAEWEQSS